MNIPYLKKNQNRFILLRQPLFLLYIYVITAEMVAAWSQGIFNIRLEKILKSSADWLKQVCTGTGEGAGDMLGPLHI